LSVGGKGAKSAAHSADRKKFADYIGWDSILTWEKQAMRKFLIIALVAGTLSNAVVAHAESAVEVVHWWSSGSDAAALNVLKEDLMKRSIAWKDSPLSAAGDQARPMLRTRVVAGNPPEAMHMLGFAVTTYTDENQLADLTPTAAKEGWDSVVPLAIQKFSKVSGKWVAVPISIHRTNWVWANKKIFEKLKISPPKTFDELLAAAAKIKKAGYIVLAHGGQPWQEATLFESAVLSAGGPDFYRKAMIDLDELSLGSPTMERAFEQMAKLKTLVDPNFANRDWNMATAMVANEKAGMQIMGDWAKEEFVRAGKKPGADFLCFPYPGTDGSVLFSADLFGMFKVGKDQIDPQMRLIVTIMDKNLQERFNLVKGSIPARMDASDKIFDACAKKSMSDVRLASQRNTLLGSFAHGYAVPDTIRGVMTDVISKAFNAGTAPGEAAKQLVAAVKSVKK
jgi:glucose/mannose transport system substrate-binding protein